MSERWIRLVHGMLGAGLGADDIAVRVRKMGHPNTTGDDVRLEVALLREEGRLMDVLKLEVRG